MKPLLPLVLVIILSCASPVPNDSKDASPDSLVRINQSVTAVSLTAERDSVGISEELRFTCHAEDPDGDSLTYAWSAFKTKEDGSVDVNYTYYFGFDTTQFTQTGNEAVWIAPRWPGTYKVFCKVTDSAGYEEMAETAVVVSVADCIYFVTDQYRYQINEPITRTVGNNKYPTVTIESCFSGYFIERFEKKSWQWIGGGLCPALILGYFDLEYGKNIFATDYSGIEEPGLYRFRYPYSIARQEPWIDLFSNTFVVE